ncbi:MAG: hypothetical protein M1822_001872 [Bathelium mastoideum]|nr:MAG: hypothetical protein M1822_001872 [Bathelium mastoideum]
MEKIHLGTTQLPTEVILEYVEALKATYTTESYDLFSHNCNNFSHDFSMFLVGEGIPSHITSLPQTVLNTPFGQMIKPQLDQTMRTITQAPVPSQQKVDPLKANNSSSQNHPNGTRTAATRATHAKNGTPTSTPSTSTTPDGKVHNVTETSEIADLLSRASRTCAIIFFTSSTCAPCKLVYGPYEALAAEAGPQAVFIKVDINQAFGAAQQFDIRATPTFISFLRGDKQEQWSGANEAQLRGNIRLLLQAAFPPHPHASLKLSNLSRMSLAPVTYRKTPPLDKVLAKMGDAGRDPSFVELKSFVQQRDNTGASETPLPNLTNLAIFLDTATSRLPTEAMFAAVDVLRAALIDARISGFFAGDKQESIEKLLQYITVLPDCPYNLRLVTIQLACNLFTSTLWPKVLSMDPRKSSLLVQLVTVSLLDDKHPSLRVAAASLAFNLAAANFRTRREENRELILESDQVELAASLLETLSVEKESKDVAKALTLTIGLLVFYASPGGELLDMCSAMDAAATVQSKEVLSGGDPVINEIARKLLGRGLR